MRSICCECGILFDVKEPFDQDDETHGFCDECFEIIMNNIEIRRKTREKDSNSPIDSLGGDMGVRRNKD